ncbi:ABC transporter substrate-binding protein [Neptunomonas marina]|uniref:ABC transporter substrate-binding protein n=1 Tax=Neptunomonas marina TaxID=1815562 RepID=A0A437Q7P2_9GAMM|nr:ABC transporter substrate binding protein [Neptunomonas marina]RVU30561.1 hypothetical protein EOE65_09565 [Neptunomonas marina]
MLNWKSPKEQCRYWIASTLLWVVAFSASTATASVLGVLYPDAPPPYRQVFSQLIDGIRDQYLGMVKLYPLDTSTDSTTLQAQLRNDGVDAIITLGRSGYTQAEQLTSERPLVSGALPLIPGQGTGVSLIPDPEELFVQLKRLSPNIQQVHTILSEQSRWLEPIAQAAATRQRIKLTIYYASDIASTLALYKRLLTHADRLRDALWLPPDRQATNESVILPILLQEAWEKRLIIFASKPSFVRRGALFSLFPDNERTGRRLAELVGSLQQEEENLGIEFSKSDKLVINQRTAAHLGIKLTPAQLRSVYRTYPQP